MIIFEVHGTSVFLFPPEGYAPWAVDVHGKPQGLTSQLVVAEARHVHVFRHGGRVKRIEAAFYTGNQVGPKLCCHSLFPKGFQHTTAEGPDHLHLRKAAPYLCKAGHYRLARDFGPPLLCGRCVAMGTHHSGDGGHVQNGISSSKSLPPGGSQLGPAGPRAGSGVRAAGALL